MPIGTLALAFLIGYGLLELTGVFVQPIMRPVWRTPGWPAIDAVASFVGSYSLTLLITDRLYEEGKYTTREAAIIATGFATVSVAFMIIVARALGLMEVWTLYFWSTLIITFAVSALVARLWPITSMPHEAELDPPLPVGRSRISAAMEAGLEQAGRVPSLLKSSIIDGLRMASLILPSIMAGGRLGFWAAIVSVGQVLFLSACIPCVMATTIPISFGQLLVIWYVRTVASILLAAPVAWFAVSMGWLT